MHKSIIESTYMTREVAQNLGEELALKYNPQGIVSFPFSKILEENPDLSIVYVALDENVSGVSSYISSNKRFVVAINSSKAINRQYFTTAHELGHYFLHKDIIEKEGVLISQAENIDGDYALYRLDDSEYSEIETEANYFAASLLMPKDQVHKVWSTLHKVEECAKVFNVSVSAMSVRLEKLGLVS